MTTHLINAVKQRKPEEIRRLLDLGARVDEPNEKGNTPLLFAVSLSDLRLAELLLSHRAQVNWQNNEGNHALTIAADRSDDEMIRLLLQHGAGVNLPNGKGTTALLFAVRKNAAAIMKALLDAGANADHANKLGTTALMYAAMDGHADCVSLLLQRGAALNKQDLNGYTALLHAAAGDRQSILLQLLAAGANPGHTAGNGVQALMLAAEHDNTTAAAELLRALAARNIPLEPNKVYHYARAAQPDGTVLLWMKQLAGFKLTGTGQHGRFLRSIQADIRLMRLFAKYDWFPEGETRAVMQETALRAGDEALFIRLLPKERDDVWLRSRLARANWPQVDARYRQLLLWTAVSQGWLDLTECMLDSGLGPEACLHPDGQTQNPLAVALQYDRLQVLELLLQRGGDPDLRASPGGTTLLQAAIAKGRQEMIGLLLAYGADTGNGNQLLLAAVRLKDEKLALYLLQRGINPDAGLAEAQVSSLVEAVRSRMKLVVERMLQDNRHTSRRDEALIQAVEYREPGLALDFLRCGAASDAKDSRGRSVLRLSLENKLYDVADVLAAAEVNKPELDSAFLDALRLKDQRAAVLLLRHGAAPALPPGAEEESLLFYTAGRRMLQLVEWLVPLTDKPQLFRILMWAVHSKERETAAVLLRKGVSPNIVDSAGNSALMAAVQTGLTELVYDLRLAGADVEHRNNQGQSARSLAAALGHQGMVRILDSRLRRSSEPESRSFLSRLFGSSRPAVRRERFTHCWACRRSIDSISFLICRCGWIICSCGACGCTYNKANN